MGVIYKILMRKPVLIESEDMPPNEGDIISLALEGVLGKFRVRNVLYPGQMGGNSPHWKVSLEPYG
jgi:hypothetical protein